jgi:hypothetical protein
MTEINRKRRILVQYSRLALFYLLPALFFLIVAGVIQAIYGLYTNNQCHTSSAFKLTKTSPQAQVRFGKESGQLRNNQLICFRFQGKFGEKLDLNTNNKITIETPNKKIYKVQGSSEYILSETGTYLIYIYTKKQAAPYEVSIKIEEQNIVNKPAENSFQFPPNLISGKNDIAIKSSYNVKNNLHFKPNSQLNGIINDIVNLVARKGLPTDRLSVSLIDLRKPRDTTYASYLDQEPRYPASIVKLFWMVALYGQYQSGEIPVGKISQEKLDKMIKDSDNEAASFILDEITKTKSHKRELPPDKLHDWMSQRYSVNHFFTSANYQNLNISQKTFPIPYLQLNDPEGSDLQIRQINGKKSPPIRNYLTTYSVARLLYEIHTDQSISKAYSQEMKSLLKRDLHPEAWKNKPFNAIEGFLGESLPHDTYFASKMGWTFNNRNDAAIIISSDKKLQYILVVFGDDKSFYEDKTIFPAISKLVYDKMRKQ